MRSSLLLLTILFLMVVETCQAYCEETQESEARRAQPKQKVSNIYKLPPSLLKRYYDGGSYDGFVGLMGRRNSDSKEFSSSPQKRDMHDFFVGLMGRRNTDSDSPTDISQETFPSLEDPKYSTKCRVRFQR
ncbi:tachykinin-3 [Microcaecilia unicolor]|uniref:Tachykinin-3 n=1 Tax=Microcaecilia unicolor TaxID=1415580 RepID=A0A6P7XCX8_9AMPH|nr:tachykinin-3 [Microcaecilia unicolor]